MTQQPITKKAYQSKVEKQIREIDVEIEKLKGIANQVKMNAKIEYVEDLRRLTALREKMEERMDKFRPADQNTWEEIRQRVNAALIELQRAVKDVVTRFFNTEKAHESEENK